jgi:hypothetical protein
LFDFLFDFLLLIQATVVHTCTAKYQGNRELKYWLLVFGGGVKTIGEFPEHLAE